MLKKIYEKVINFILENQKEIIFLLSFYILMTYPLPYYILVSGGTIDVSDRVEIEKEYDQEGSFNLAYVNELQGTLPTVLLSYVMPHWTLYEETAYTFDTTEDMADISARDQMYLLESLQNSVKIAYEAAEKEFKITDTKHYTYYVYDFVKEYSDLRVGDVITSYDGKTLDDLDEYSKYIQTKEIGEEIEITIERGSKTINTKLKVYEEENKKYTGIVIMNLFTYETEPKITFKFKKNESGSSGGLTLALAIYNKLTEEDITKGLKIVGTGTINADGSVGSIGGVEYKLKGAIKSKADIFLVPSGENYEQVKKLKEKEGYKIDIIEVSTFEEALQKLKAYKK